MEGWITYFGTPRRRLKLGSAKTAASYWLTNGRKNVHARRCGREASKWQAHTQRPRDARCSTSVAGCTSCTSTRSASSASFLAFTRFISMKWSSASSVRTRSLPRRAACRVAAVA